MSPCAMRGQLERYSGSTYYTNKVSKRQSGKRFYCRSSIKEAFYLSLLKNCFCQRETVKTVLQFYFITESYKDK